MAYYWYFENVAYLHHATLLAWYHVILELTSVLVDKFA
jgi:hypothetical protein